MPFNTRRADKKKPKKDLFPLTEFLKRAVDKSEIGKKLARKRNAIVDKKKVAARKFNKTKRKVARKLNETKKKLARKINK